MNNAPSSAFAANAATNFRMKTAPFIVVSSLSFGIHPRKKWSHALLLAFLTEKYEVFEWILRIISDAQKRTILSRLDAI